MEKRGLINPISVRQMGEGRGEKGETANSVVSPLTPPPSPLYELIAGERRYRAARELKWDQIDCRIWPAETTPAEVEMLSLVENLQRADLNPFEVASAYKILTQDPYNMGQEDIAAQCGQSRGTVSQYLMIAGLDPQVQQAANQLAKLDMAHLLQICRLKTPKVQIELAKKASAGDWTVKKLAGEVDKRTRGDGRKETGEKASSPLTPHPAPFNFKLSGRDVLVSARIPLDNNIDPELAKLKAALLQWLKAPQSQRSEFRVPSSGLQHETRNTKPETVLKADAPQAAPTEPTETKV
jgi:ParB/RepB/Spo0J family partition protein